MLELQAAVSHAECPPQKRRIHKWTGRLLGLPALLAAGLAVVSVSTISNRFADPDLWWHLKVGQIVVTTHSIPAFDTFSYTTGNHAWTAHEWLAQAAMYAVYAA